MTTTASPQRWSAPDACRLAAFACMAACVAAQSSKGHGGVEDAQGRRLEGATTPGDNAPIRTHHVDLIFKTLLCVPARPPPPARAAFPWLRTPARLLFSRLDERAAPLTLAAAAPLTLAASAAAQLAERADDDGVRADRRHGRVRWLRHVGYRRQHSEAPQQEEEDEDIRRGQGRVALTQPHAAAGAAVAPAAAADVAAAAGR